MDQTLQDLLNELDGPYWHALRPYRRRMTNPSVEVKAETIPSEFGNKSCSVLAVSKALDTDLGTAEALLKECAHYDPSIGVRHYPLMTFMKEWGWKYVYLPKRFNIRSKDAINKLPARCVVDFSRHVSYYEDGVLYDTGAAGRSAGSKIVKGYYVEQA